MAVITSSKIGVDLTQSQTSPTFTYGDTALGTQNSEWVYVLANGSIGSGDCVAITGSGTATRATPTLLVGTKNTEVAFAQFNFADTEAGWVCRRGYGMIVAVSATVSSSATLYLATTSGKVSDVAGSATLVGIQLAGVSTTASTTTTSAAFSWPRCAAPGT